MTGRVTRLGQFGAFVELEPGVDGLAHVSTFAPTGHSGGWARSVPVETRAAFEILSVDVGSKRIGLALVPEEEAGRSAAATRPGGNIVAGARLTGKVQRLESFGVFVFLGPGRVGLIPLGETGVAREADLKAAFPAGSDDEVIIVEVDLQVLLNRAGTCRARSRPSTDRTWPDEAASRTSGSGRR